MKKIHKEIFYWIGILILMCFILLGILCCDNRTEEERYHDYLEKQKQEKIEKAHEERWHGFDVIVIDSCEYLYKKYDEHGGYAGYGYGFMAHKGNCKFCEKRNKKSLVR